MIAPTTRTPALPPAGARPPAPPWARIGAWLALLACLSLAAARQPLLDWAAAQPRPADIQGAKPTSPTASQQRLVAIAASAATQLLRPPSFTVIQGLAALGLATIGMELSLAAAALVMQSAMLRRQGRLVLRVRLPQTPNARAATDTGVDLLRAVHRQLPSHGAALGQAPWLALTLSARPDEPCELGAVVGGGTHAQRQSWAAALRKTITGLAPDAVVDEQTDAMADAVTRGGAVAWRTWRLALPPSFPLRPADDSASSDLLGPLVAALQPRQGVLATEVQLVLQPRLDDVHLAQGWRADALRRLLRLKARSEYALTPDIPALEAKLSSPAFHTTLRAVSVAADDVQAAQAELAELDAVIGQYAARSGSRLQRWTSSDSGSIGASATVAPSRAVQTGIALAGIALSLAGIALQPHLLPLVTSLAGSYPLLPLPAPIARRLPAVFASILPLLPSLLALYLVQRRRGHLTHIRGAAILARTPRAVPPPTLLWFAAWRGPAILGPEELAGLWHLPTPALGRLVRWLPCRYLPPPPHAFAQGAHGRLILGTGRHSDGTEGPIGLPLRDARQGLAFTAPPGVGKTQLASNLADQLRPNGYTLIDGKGDDAGNLVETMRARIPLKDEARLVILDVLDAAWPIGLNPLAGVRLDEPGALDQVFGQIEAIFARLDPETWGKAPRMKNYLRKATLLVLAGEAHPTIAHVKQALLDERYRQTLLPQCTNVEVRDFWTVEFPQVGEQQKASRDALVSRFDMLLDSELTRYLFNQATPALSFADAIAERLMVLAPLPHRTLGGLAGPVGMLLFQSLMRAAFARPGSDLTRTEYGFIGDEFQVLVENCDTKDIRDALTQVRAFGLVTIIANQLHAQLGDLAEYALTAISNRILLRTQEPDATLYARHYAESGVTASDISGQEPREHQYAWIGVEGRLTRLFSMRPLPWQPALELAVERDAGPAWNTVLPEDSPTPHFDAQVLTLVYGEHADAQLLAQALAASTDEQWAALLARWDAIRRCQRAHILAHPGCIPDTHERQRWLSRLRAARPRVLAQAEYARIRQAISAGSAGSRAAPEARAGSRPAPGASAEPASTTLDAPPSQQPHHPELEERAPRRLTSTAPNDLQLDPPEPEEAP